ncbi:hypothetical protein TKK_0004641 [Trichogramma kaykai]|uniref:peptidylprolyl isomerase n=1 Tax=Trichogramma kaykai TaxID=54128 RepID=A0ABD2XMX0_9HYME
MTTTVTPVIMPDLKEPLPEPEENHTQADFIKDELNFNVDVNDPLTKASLNEPAEDEWMDILGSNQLLKKVVKAGIKNTRPNRSDLCTIDIIGRLEDGTIVEEHEDLVVQLGDMETIQGIDLALALMNTEEEAEVKVGARFGYGKTGRTSPLPVIPPNTDLVYNVTLKSVTMERDIEEMPVAERQKIGNKKRERGNWWFARDECIIATQCYRKALDYLTIGEDSEMSLEKNTERTTESMTAEELQLLLEDSLKVHNNLAAAQLKCEAYDAALKSVENVLRCQPNNVKALFRKGKILHHQGEHAKACTVLSQALRIEPDNKAIQQEIAILKKKSVKDAHQEKNLYRKMLGNPAKRNKDTTKNDSENKIVSKNLTWSLLGGTIVAVFGIIAYKLVA